MHHLLMAGDSCSTKVERDNVKNVVYIEFSPLKRLACLGKGLPPDLVQDMFRYTKWATNEGIELSMCLKILKIMNGEVRYIGGSDRSCFLVILRFPMSWRGLKGID